MVTINRLIMIIAFFSVLLPISHADCEIIPVTIDTTTFIDQACIGYETTFSLDVNVSVWEAVIQHPILLATLWQAYEFEPVYQVSTERNMYHLDDGSGLEANVSFAGGDTNIRVILAQGRLHNWGLPIGVKGNALCLFQWSDTAESLTVSFRIYGEGTGSAADIIIKAFSPVLRFFINRRISSNVRDLAEIINDIVYNQEKVREMLPEEMYDEYSSFISTITHINK